MTALPLQPAQFPEPVQLADGTSLLVRAIRIDDIPGLCRFHQRLSRETLYRRFLSPCPTPSNRTLAYLAGVDHSHREALVAVIAGEIVAVARYDRAAGTREAEVAIVVEDAWQRRRIGMTLLDRLSALALARSIEAFTGSMLAENRAAYGILKALAPGSYGRLQGSELTFRTPLLADRPPEETRPPTIFPRRPGQRRGRAASSSATSRFGATRR